MSNSFARPLTRAFDGETLPLHCLIKSVTSIFNFSARSGNVRDCLADGSAPNTHKWAIHDSYKASGDSSCRFRVGISVSLVEAPPAVKEW
jgi:hypothetical protein